MKDLILLDDQCPFCQRSILFILKRDHHKRFLFSGLHGLAAEKVKHLSIGPSESIILIENYSTTQTKIVYRSQAIFRIFWKLGGIYKLIGWKFIFPSFFFDWAYRIVARNRKHLCKTNASYKTELYKERFLP